MSREWFTSMRATELELTAALFLAASTWKLSRCLITADWIIKWAIFMQRGILFSNENA
jgi:hypothetical protein